MTPAKKQKRKERLLKELYLLDHMNNKLWVQIWASFAVLFILFCFAMYNFHHHNTLIGQNYLLSILGLTVVFSLIGFWLKTNLYKFWIVPFLGIIIILSAVLETNVLDAANVADKEKDKSNTPRHQLTREECVERAISKRKILLAKLENAD